MEYIKFLKSKKIIVVIIAVVIVGVTGLVFYAQRLPTYKITIEARELLPFVSHEQARTTICHKMNGRLFDEICQKEFNSVGKNDAGKIGALFSLLKKIDNDRSIDDYERLLLAQAVFASLPTKDSPLAQHSEFPALLANLENLISGANVAYAKESNNSAGMGQDGFKQMMLSDLAEVISNLPEGDNAWTISVSVSKYGWVNGVRQPLYSEQFVASFNPYPGVSTENKAQWEQYDLTHIKSRVGTFATNQSMYSGSLTEGSGEMIGYSFTMGSWQSKPYGTDSVLVVAESGPSEDYYDNTHHYTEENYTGDDLLADLLKAVKMPSREQPAEDSQEKAESKNDVKDLNQTRNTEVDCLEVVNRLSKKDSKKWANEIKTDNWTAEKGILTTKDGDYCLLTNTYYGYADGDGNYDPLNERLEVTFTGESDLFGEKLLQELRAAQDPEFINLDDDSNERYGRTMIWGGTARLGSNYFRDAKSIFTSCVVNYSIEVTIPPVPEHVTVSEYLDGFAKGQGIIPYRSYDDLELYQALRPVCDIFFKKSSD